MWSMWTIVHCKPTNRAEHEKERRKCHFFCRFSASQMMHWMDHSKLLVSIGKKCYICEIVSKTFSDRSDKNDPICEQTKLCLMIVNIIWSKYKRVAVRFGYRIFVAVVVFFFSIGCRAGSDFWFVCQSASLIANLKSFSKLIHAHLLIHPPARLWIWRRDIEIETHWPRWHHESDKKICVHL